MCEAHQYLLMQKIYIEIIDCIGNLSGCLLGLKCLLFAV